MERRKSRQIFVGNVAVGWDAPITIQSMTNTKTTDAAATLAQIKALVDVGADIVRVSVPDVESAKSFAELVRQSPIPLISDIHFDYKIGIMTADGGAGCVRINPGNIGTELGVAEIVAACKANNCSIRIGVNAGSLEKTLVEKYGEPCSDAMVESGINQIRMLEKHGFENIKIALKSSDTKMTMDATRKIATLIPYPLHIGVTEAGTARTGSVKSAIGIGGLLQEGIGDTLRVSLSGDPTEEVRVGWDILKTLKLRSRGLDIVACPTCARRGVDVESVAKDIEKRCSDIVKPIRVSVMGCVVNGIGEAKKSDIGVVGIDLERGESVLYLHGEKLRPIKNSDIAAEVEKLARKLCLK